MTRSAVDELRGHHPAAVAADVEATVATAATAMAVGRRRAVASTARATTPWRRRRPRQPLAEQALGHRRAALVAGAERPGRRWRGDCRCDRTAPSLDVDRPVKSSAEEPWLDPRTPGPRRRAASSTSASTDGDPARAGRPDRRGAAPAPPTTPARRRDVLAGASTPSASCRCCRGATAIPAALVAERVGADAADDRGHDDGRQHAAVARQPDRLDIQAGGTDVVLIGGAEAWRTRMAFRGRGVTARLDGPGRRRARAPSHRRRAAR